MIDAADLFGEKIMKAVSEATRHMGCQALYYCGELPDTAPEGDYYAVFEDGTMVRGKYPEDAEALVVANGEDAKHYQLL